MGDRRGDATIDVDVPTALRAAAPIRHRLRDHLVARGATTASVRRAQLVVSELVTNAIVHGSPPVHVRFRTTATDVVVAVSDGSPRRPEVGDPPPSALGGRGMLLVDRVSDSWGIDPGPGGGKTVWCRVSLVEA